MQGKAEREIDGGRKEVNKRIKKVEKGGISVITNKQIKLVWVLARQIGMDSDLLHKLVFKVTGNDSLKALSIEETNQVIDSLIYAGAKVKKTIKPRGKALPPNVVELITPDQVRFIKYLEKELGWHENPERLKGFLKRTIKGDVAKTKKQGIKAIQGLLSMVRRQSEGRKNGKQRQDLCG